MSEQRLLERIRLMEQDPDSREVTEPVQVVGSILEYLRMILNTRQGSVEIAPDFGVPDFTDMFGASGMESVRDIEAAMTKVITKYEPRMQNVKIEFSPQEDAPLALQFKLQAKLMLENRDMPVVFETTLDPDGRITVKDS